MEHASPGFDAMAAWQPGPVRPGQRARRLRAGLHRPHQGPQEPRHRPARTADPRKPDPSRRDGRRPAAGRRRRHPDPAARRLLPPRLRQARHHAAGDRPIRRRHGVPAARARVADGVRAGNRARDPRRGPGAARLARRAHRQQRPVRAHEGSRAGDPAGVRRRAASRDMDQDALERKLYIIRKRAGHAIQSLHLRHGKEFYVPSFSTRTIVVQGHAARAPGRRVLPRPARRVDGVRARDGAPALLDQHVPDVGPGASVPLHLATTARSTRCAATSTGSARAKARSPRRCWATTCRSCGR